jgi:hypothetical protein
MTMERMKSQEGRGEMEQEIDTVSHISLSQRIEKLAQEGSLLAKELQRDDISEEERESLGKELENCIKEGSELAIQKNRIESRLL